MYDWLEDFGAECSARSICSLELWSVAGGGGGGGSVRAMLKVTRFLISKCWQVCDKIYTMHGFSTGKNI